MTTLNTAFADGAQLETFYDRHLRLYTHLAHDLDSNQIGDAEYSPTRRHAQWNHAQIAHDMFKKHGKITANTLKLPVFDPARPIGV